MTKTKQSHTPGLWEIGGPLTHEGPGWEKTICINTPHGCLGVLFPLRGNEIEANARLITAASELLEAAKAAPLPKAPCGFTEDLGRCDGNPYICSICRRVLNLKTAIAKAEDNS